MRTLCLLLLVCFLIALPVAAVSVNPASVGNVAKIATIHPAASMQPLKTSLPATTTVPVHVPLTISSVPAGAKVIYNGWPSDKITPVTLYPQTGPITIGLMLDGYKNYTTTITLVEGHPVAINAQLERKLTVKREDVVASKNWGTPQIITDEANTNMCLSGEKCLALYEAAEQFPNGEYGYQVDGPVCGRVTLSNGTAVPRYCISVPADNGIQVGRVPVLVTVPAAQQVNAVNASALQGMQAVMTPRALGGKKQVGAFDSFLGFFNGLFGGPVCHPMQTACGSKCVNLTVDSLNCGSCDYTCFDPAVCSGGECVDSSAGLWTAPIPL
jgi:hypothetical protein